MGPIKHSIFIGFLCGWGDEACERQGIRPIIDWKCLLDAATMTIGDAEIQCILFSPPPSMGDMPISEAHRAHNAKSLIESSNDRCLKYGHQGSISGAQSLGSEAEDETYRQMQDNIIAVGDSGGTVVK